MKQEHHGLKQYQGGRDFTTVHLATNSESLTEKANMRRMVLSVTVERDSISKTSRGSTSFEKENGPRGRWSS